MVNTLRRSGIAALVIAGVGIVFGTQSPTATALPIAQGQGTLSSSDASSISSIDEDEELTSPQSADKEQEQNPPSDDAPQSAPPSGGADTPISDGDNAQSDTQTGQTAENSTGDHAQSQASSSSGNAAPSAGSATHSGQNQSGGAAGASPNTSSGAGNSSGGERPADDPANTASPLEPTIEEEGVGPAAVPREATRVARSEEALAKAKSAEPIITSRIARTGEPITGVILGAAALTMVAAGAIFARQRLTRK